MPQASQLAAELEVAKANLERATNERNAHVAAHEGKVRALELTAARAVKNYDKAKADLEATTAQYERAATGLANLEHAVQELQAEKDLMVDEATAGLRKRIETMTTDLAAKAEALAVAEQQQRGLEQQAAVVAELESERNLANGLCKSLENDVARLQRELGEAQGKLAEALSSAPTNVDIELIRNMFVAFCEQTGEKKAQALLPLAKILQLSDADKYAVGIRPHRGFFSQLISGRVAYLVQCHVHAGISKILPANLQLLDVCLPSFAVRFCIHQNRHIGRWRVHHLFDICPRDYPQ